ncbi:hypothetical protein BKA93DRAFT_827272 [Sparassis latifolia]
MTTTKTNLDALFPAPYPPPSPLSPGRWPGITQDSTLALGRLLKENHEKWHIFFNDMHFHNHTSHHLLAIYYLGASPDLLDAAYQTHVSRMRPARKSPDPITSKNFHQHLGDENFYSGYLEFFSAVLLEKGAAATIEEYIFSPYANILAPELGKPPMKMLNRFLSGIFHPLIHTGYGVEFGLPGMVAEGLAQTAVHGPGGLTLVRPSLFQYASSISSDVINAAVNRLTKLMPSLVLESAQHALRFQHKPAQDGVHALTILSRILHDPAFSLAAIGLPVPDDSEENAFEHVVRVRGEAIVAHAEAWSVDGTSPEEVARKTEEIIWMNVMLYGVCGWSAREKSTNGKFKPDFFFMHMVTSVLFLHSLTAYLTPTSSTILLRTYLINALTWWVARGRPVPPLRAFFSSPDAPTAHPTEARAHPAPARDALVCADPSPNPWLPLLQTALVHPDDHLCKLQRALAHFAALYGATPKGHFAALAEGDAPLEGAGEMDGTLFVRAAGLTADALGWMREGDERRSWDFGGFYA